MHCDATLHLYHPGIPHTALHLLRLQYSRIRKLHDFLFRSILKTDRLRHFRLALLFPGNRHDCYSCTTLQRYDRASNDSHANSCAIHDQRNSNALGATTISVVQAARATDSLFTNIGDAIALSPQFGQAGASKEHITCRLHRLSESAAFFCLCKSFFW